MMKNRLGSGVCAAILFSGTVLSARAAGQPHASIQMTSGYAKVNGLKMYYEVHGKGSPLVLLHGA